MKHIRKFNETNDPYRAIPDEEKPHILERIFKAVGFDVAEDGVVTVTNKFAKLLCEMAVKQGDFEKNGDKYKLKSSK